MNEAIAMVRREFVRPGVRLLVVDERHGALMEDGTWVVVPEGERLPEFAGMWVSEAVAGALYSALAEYYGDKMHSATETKVLREWLKAEQDRFTDLLFWCQRDAE